MSAPSVALRTSVPEWAPHTQREISAGHHLLMALLALEAARDVDTQLIALEDLGRISSQIIGTQYGSDETSSIALRDLVRAVATETAPCVAYWAGTPHEEYASLPDLASDIEHLISAYAPIKEQIMRLVCSNDGG